MTAVVPVIIDTNSSFTITSNISDAGAVASEIIDSNSSFTITSNIADASAAAATVDSNNTTKTIELSENFYITNRRKSNVKIQVKLSGEGIYLRRETEENDQINEQLIRIEDIIGSRCGQRIKKRGSVGLSSCKRATVNAEADGNNESNDTAKDTCAYLYVYAYVKREKPSVRRDRTVRILRFRSFERYEKNLKSAERWHRAIQVNKGQLGIEEMAGQREKKELLILLNPKSGSGKGREMFQKQVAPVLKEAEVQYDLQVTTHANFAHEYVSRRKDLLQRYSGIIVASGDGLFYEVLNGLMERADWRSITRLLPLGIIPCGSGNGLAKSIAYLYKEPYEPKPILNATLTCVSGTSAPMDIVRVELASKGGNKPTEMYSFLSIGWGLIADVDIQSERLRSIGAPRFTIWTIHRLIHLRTYKGKLSYLPWKKENVVAPPSQQQLSTTTVNTKIKNSNEEEFFDIPINNRNSGTDDDDDEFADAISLDRTSFRPHVNSWNSATSRGTAYYSIVGGQSIRSRRSILSKIEAANAEFENERSLVSTIPPLSIPLPIDGSEWQCEEGEYVMVHAAYTTHLSTDCLFAPDSLLNDGIIYLVIIRAGCSRSQLLQFCMGMSTGTHLPEEPNKYIQVVPVHAFRIEPSGDDGIITVDGERVNYGPIQGEIFPGMINVMVPNRK